MTFSIAGRDASGFGIAISSSSPAVAARCVHLRAGIGAVASQNVTDPALGPAILDRIAAGATADAALSASLAQTPFSAWRQIVVVSGHGHPAIHTGENGLGVTGAACGSDAAAAGNLLADARVPQAMLASFEQSSGLLAERLLVALEAGYKAGGEAGPIHSAGLAVMRDVSWPIVDLRVDWSDDPVGELRDLWQIYAPQIEDYVIRALNPDRAPRFGVPGDP